VTLLGGEHWVVVLERDGGTLYTAEGNFSSSVNITNTSDVILFNNRHKYPLPVNLFFAFFALFEKAAKSGFIGGFDRLFIFSEFVYKKIQLF